MTARCSHVGGGPFDVGSLTQQLGKRGQRIAIFADYDVGRIRAVSQTVLTLFVNLGAAPVDLPDLPDAEPVFTLHRGGAPGAFAAWLGNG